MLIALGKCSRIEVPHKSRVFDWLQFKTWKSLLSENVSESTRQTRMSELFVLLLNDESRWVRLSAYQELGKFIASFTHHKEQEEGLFYWLFAPNNENLDEENQDDKEDAQIEEESKSNNIQSQNQNVQVVTPVEEPEFSAAKYWKDDLPELDFDSLSLDDDEEMELQCDNQVDVETKTDQEADQIEEEEQNKSHEEEEDLQASGDSEELEKKVKEESEASTPDKAIYEALVCHFTVFWTKFYYF